MPRHPPPNPRRSYRWAAGKSPDLASRGQCVNCYTGEEETVRMGTREILELAERHGSEVQSKIWHDL